MNIKKDKRQKRQNNTKTTLKFESSFILLSSNLSDICTNSYNLTKKYIRYK